MSKSKPARRLLRSNSTVSTVRDQLDQQERRRSKKHEKTETREKQKEKEKFTREDIYEIDFDNIVDHEERAEAYKNIANQLNQFLLKERNEYLQESTKNLLLIAEQTKEIEDRINENILLHNQLLNTKEILNQINKKMEVKDIIASIPMFRGEKKQLDSFINTCDIYVKLVKEDQKESLLMIIKAKITGDALSKIQPIDELQTWKAIKEKLRSKIFTKVSFEYAQEDLNNVKQEGTESIEDYGNKVKTKLRAMIDSMASVTTTDAEKKIMRLCAEKQAISKFTQNLINNNIKILLSAAGKTTLEESISFALIHR